MERLKKFNEFINEDVFELPDPSEAGSDLAKALGQNSQVKEVGKNAGTDVNKIQRSAGSSSGQSWCMSWVYYIFDEFSKKMGVKNPVYKTAGVMEQWKNTKGKKITVAEARSNFSLVKPGQIFITTRGAGFGHTGIVTSVDQNGKKFTTIEANIKTKGGGEGIGVVNRTLNDANLVGFIDYFPDRDADFDRAFTKGLKSEGITDASNLKVERNLPVDAAIGTETGAGDPDATSKNTGGILGKIIGGAAKFMGSGDSNSAGKFGSGDTTITDTDALTAFAAFGVK